MDSPYTHEISHRRSRLSCLSRSRENSGGGQKLLNMDRAVHPRGARAALRALLTGPHGPYVRLVWHPHGASLQCVSCVFPVYLHAASRPVLDQVTASAVGLVAICGL